YGGMRAANGLISALNIINQEHETRSIVKIYGRAVGLTLAAVVIALIGLSCGVAFAWLQMQTKVLFGPFTEFLITALTWLVAILLGSVGFGLIMRYGPDRRPAKWRWLTPGSLLATILWIAISFGFSIYVAYVSDYNATYGSLSAVVVFLMWLFLSAYGVLLGALLNAEIERQTTVDTTVGPDRPPGRRGAILADIVEGPMPTLAMLEKRRIRRADRARARADGDLPAEAD
ncbi:MAG: YihY/virulence factor BrkB family protein, partial [Novosphingobium sp.]|nr:YihY/virulence factor BrkB family protein [Novosphingobium sp.]